MKKVVALIVALVSALAISVAAFAADPSYDSSVNGSKAITQDILVRSVRVKLVLWCVTLMLSAASTRNCRY